MSACEERGLPRPEFRYEMGTFMVILRSALTDVEIPTPGEYPGLSDRQQRALAYVREHGSITRREYMALFGLGAAQAAEDLAGLTAVGAVVREGAGRSTRYRPQSQSSAG